MRSSKRVTSRPASAKSDAAKAPAGPPPITATRSRVIAWSLEACSYPDETPVPTRPCPHLLLLLGARRRRRAARLLFRVLHRHLTLDAHLDSLAPSRPRLHAPASNGLPCSPPDRHLSPEISRRPQHDRC